MDSQKSSEESESHEESGSAQPSENLHPVDHQEINRQNRADLVTFYFSQGHSIPQIIKLLKRDHGIKKLPRDVPYQDLAYATNAKWLTYNPPRHIKFSDELSDKYPYLLEAHVPRDGARMAVVAEGAQLVSRSIGFIAEKLAKEYGKEWDFPMLSAAPEPRRTRKNHSSPDVAIQTEDLSGTIESEEPNPAPLDIEIRIGVSGGRTIGTTIMELGRLLASEIEEWEIKLKETVFEALQKNGRGDDIPKGLAKRRFRVRLRPLFINLVSGFDQAAFNHPIGILTAMINSHELLASRAELMCFSGNSYVKIGENHQIPGGNYPPNQVRKFIKDWGLDIILTSAGCIGDKHSSLRRYYKHDESAIQILKDHHVKGDILWMPLTSTRPFNFSKDLSPEEIEILKYSPTTLFNLEDLAAHKKEGSDVVLLLAPCGGCYEPKTEIMKAILNQGKPLISHLVVDRETTAEVLGKS